MTDKPKTGDDYRRGLVARVAIKLVTCPKCKSTGQPSDGTIVYCGVCLRPSVLATEGTEK